MLNVFFHFIKAIREKLKKYSNNNNRYLSKVNYVIIKNIELLCFIKEDRLKEYKTFILDYLNKIKINIKFIEYLKSYWFDKNNREYNYSYFIEKYFINEEALNKLYTTNNIIESLHSKTNNFRQNTISNKLNFINSMKNIFLNDIIRHNNYKRYDFITQSLMYL